MSDNGTSVDIKNRTRFFWEEFCSKVNKAAVFLDDVCAECLHWQGGALKLFNAGALDVKQFSSFESGRHEQKKAVFVISGPLTKQSTKTQTLKHIIEASKFQYVVVVSTLSPMMHTLIDFRGGDDEMKAFHALEEKLLEWMGNMNYTAELVYMPLVSTPLTEQLFLLPEHADTFPLLPTDLDRLLETAREEKPGSRLTEIEFYHTPRELQLQLKLLTCALNSLMETLKVSEDVYALGHTSRIVASELASLPWAKGRRKACQRKASVLIVDRTLDIANVVSHQMETLADKVLTVLPSLESHGTDICVDMAPVCSVASNPDFNVIVPGCLAHPQDQVASSLLAAMATSKHKEALMELNRQLVEAVSRESLPLKMSGRPGRVTVEQLQSYVTLFKGNTNAVKKNSGLLQLALGTIQALQSPLVSKIDMLLGLEKGLLQCLGDMDSPSALSQITQTLEREMALPADQRGHTLEDFIVLILYIYSLADWDIDPHEEKALQVVLEKAIMETTETELPEFLQQLIGEKTSEDVSLALEGMFEDCSGLYRAREALGMFSSVYEAGSLTSQATPQPLLRQIIESIFDPKKPELTDLVYKSTGFRDLLKSGFGLFMNVSKPRPSDHPLIIIFVIGGTTTTELRQIREAVSAAKTSTQVLVGSTSLLRPADLLDKILLQDRLHPDTCLLV